MNNSPRTLYKIVGFLRRAMEIQRLPARMLSFLAKHQAQVGQRMQVCPNWDDASVDPGVIRRGWEAVKLLKNTLVHARSHLMILGPKRLRGDERNSVIVAAFDAVPTWWGIVLYSLEGHVWDIQHGPVPGSIDHINVAEAYAARVAVCHALRYSPNILILLGDNTAALRAWSKGYSMAEGMSEEVGTLEELPGCDSFRIICVDVATEENVADTPSRAVKIEEKIVLEKTRLEQSVKIASLAWERWKEAPL